MSRRVMWGVFAGGCVVTLAMVQVATLGTVAVAPSPVWLFGAFGLFALVAIVPEEKMWGRDLLWSLGVGVIAGTGAGHVLLHAGFPYSQDGGTHLWALHTLFRSMDGGILPGKWVSEIGLGIPLLLHHGPIPYLPGLVLMGLGMPVFNAFKTTLVLSLIGSGAAMYWAAKRATGRRDASVVAAMVYTFAPYHLLDTHYRGAFGESVALVAVPIFLEAAVALITGRDQRASRRLVLATLWLALTHLMTLFTAAVGAGVVALLWWMAARDRFRWAWVLPVALGAALAGYWIVPGVLEIGHTSFPLLDNSRPPRFGEHGVALSDLVWRRLWYGRLPSYTADKVAPGTTLEMPYYLGISLLAGTLAALGLNLGRKKRGQTNWEVHAWVGLTLVASAMAWLPVARVLAAWPGFPKLQFAWRFLAIASAAGAMAIGYLVVLLRERLDGTGRGRWQGALVPVVLLAVAMADFAPYTGAPDWVAPYTGAVHWFDASGKAGAGALFKDRYEARELEFPGLRSEQPPRVSGLEFPPARPDMGVQLVRGQYAEYLTPAVYQWLAHPRDVVAASRRAGIAWAFTPRSPDPVPIANPVSWASIRTDEGEVPLDRVSREGRGARFRVTLPPGHSSGKLHLLEQATPGWEVSVDGGSWEDVVSGEDGLMEVPIVRGSTVLSFRFGLTTWPRVLGLVVSLMALIVAMGLWFPGLRSRLDSWHVRARARAAETAWTERWNRWPAERRDWLSIVFIAAAVTGFRLWTGSLANGTDAIYGTAIRDLVVRGDWLSPSVHGTPYLMKPPLFFWMGALFAHVLGINEFALRLPAALGVVLAVVSTYELGRLLGGRRLGWLSAGLLVSSAPFFEYSRHVYMDPLLAGLTAASAVTWLKGVEDRRWLWWAGVLSGLAVLTKSYAGAFSVVAFLGFVVLARRDVLKDWRLWASLLLVVAIPLPWVVAELLHHPDVFLSQNLDVFRLKNEAQFSWHPYREYFYFLEMWDQDPVFSLLAVLGVGLAGVAWWQGERRWLLPVLWLVGPFALYCTLSQQRLYYLLPLLPAAALFGGLFLDRAWPPNAARGTMAVPMLVLFVVNAAPSVSAVGDVLDPNPGLRTTALQAGALAPEGATVYVWNDFFAAPEFYSGRLSTQLTPSRSLASEIERILVVGKLGIVSFVQPPDGLWTLYRTALAEGSTWFLLIQEGELERLAPGLHGACVASSSGDWHLVTFPAPEGATCRPVSKVPAKEDAYLAAARFFAGQGAWTEAGDTMMSMVEFYPSRRARAWRLATGFYLRANRPDLAAKVMQEAGEGD